MPDDRSGSALDWDVFSGHIGRGHPEVGWYAAGSGPSLVGAGRIAAGPFATRELAIVAWKAARLGGAPNCVPCLDDDGGPA